MTGLADGAEQFAELARRLREAGETGLRRELYKSINDAARPLVKEITSAEHLYPYMPDHYADVLAADLRATVSKRSGRDPGVSVRVRGRTKQRYVVRLNKGFLVHPVFARGERETWQWSWQTASVRAGFFSDPVKDAAPDLRAAVESAVRQVGKRITGY